MNRTTMILTAALVASVAAFIITDEKTGISPLRVFGSPTMEPFMAMPQINPSGSERAHYPSCEGEVAGKTE